MDRNNTYKSVNIEWRETSLEIDDEKKRSEASKVYLAWKNEKMRQLQASLLG